MLPTPNRLNLAKTFSQLKKDGQLLSTPYFTLLYRFKGEGGPQAGFVVSNKVGGATIRNHLRRQFRELVHQKLNHFPPNLQLVLIARPAAVQASYEELRLEFDKVLPKLLTHSGS